MNQILNLKSNRVGFIFIIFIATYIFALLINANLAPNDDFMMLRTLQSDKPFLYYSADFPYYNLAKYGRFTPLAALEYNIFLPFSKSPSPFLYYLYHATQFLILIFILLKIFELSIPKKSTRYLLIMLLSLIPGFTFVWFRTQLPERNFIFFLAAFLLFFINYAQKKQWGYFTLTLISANLTIYYKEIAFIIVGAFAFFYLLSSWKQSDKKTKILCALIILSALIYVIIYGLYILPKGGAFTHGKNASIPFYVTLLKNLLNYGFMTDPLIIFIFLPLCIWRLKQIFIKHKITEPLYDSMLFSAFLFVIAYFILNIQGAHYFMPIYVFVIPSVFYFLSQKSCKKSSGAIESNWTLKILHLQNFQPPWKCLIIITAFLFLFNSLPLGIHNLTYNKYMALNFNKTLNFLTNDIKINHSGERANVFLDGLNKGSGNWNYFIVSEFLLHRELTTKQFDLRAQIEDVKVSKSQPLPIAIPKIALPYSIFQNEKPSQIKTGDYLIVSSLSTDFSKKNNGDKNYLKSLENEYNLAFKTTSKLAFPMLTLKEAARYLLYKYNNLQPGKKLFTMDIRKPNFESPDFYVFIKK